MARSKRLNRPIFILAIVLFGLALLAELGMAIAAPFVGRSAGAVGWGIPALALLDVQLLLSILLMAAPQVLTDRVVGRIQGIINFVVSLLVIIGCIATGFAAFGLLMLMIGLLLAPPFGPGIYAALGYATFPNGAAATTIALIMSAKLVGSGALVTAHIRFLENKGLVLMIATSLLGTLVVSFLHGLPPGFVVSLTDVIAAIVVVILAAIWAILGLVFGAIATIKAVT